MRMYVVRAYSRTYQHTSCLYIDVKCYCDEYIRHFYMYIWKGYDNKTLTTNIFKYIQYIHHIMLKISAYIRVCVLFEHHMENGHSFFR